MVINVLAKNHAMLTKWLNPCIMYNSPHVTACGINDKAFWNQFTILNLGSIILRTDCLNLCSVLSGEENSEREMKIREFLFTYFQVKKKISVTKQESVRK